jgi:hypothetical protein
MADIFHRAGVLEADADTVSTGTIRLSFASETPVLRKDARHGVYYEVLSTRAGDCNLGLLNEQGIVLRDHDEGQEIGDVVKRSARVESDGKVRATIQLQDTDLAQSVADGARPGISCGYRQLSEVGRGASRDGIPTIRFSWAPYEISVLSPDKTPADSEVGMYRSLPMNTLDQLLDIMRSGSHRPNDRFTRADFDRPLLTELLAKKPLDGFVREMHESCDYIGGDPICGSFVRFESLLPTARLRRDLTATGGFASGGAFIQEDIHPAIELLLNHSVCTKLGAQVFPGLKGNFVAPRITSATAPQTATETGAAPVSQVTTDQIGLVPKRITIQIPISKQLSLQTGGASEDYIRALIREQVSLKLDQLVLRGQGIGNEPVGILSTPGIGNVVFGGAATWSSVLKFEKSLTDASADVGDKLGWAISGTTRNKWKQTQKVAGFPKYLLEGNQINDYPWQSTQSLSDTDQCFFGRWDDLCILIWGDGMDFVFDTVTRAKEGIEVLHVILWVNVLLRHPQSFCVSGDSAAQ